MKKRIPNKLPLPSECTRRTLLQWLGKATALSLGSGLIAACGDDGHGDFDDLFTSTDSSTGISPIDSDSDTGAAEPCEWPADPPFEPGDQSDEFPNLRERTVDPQDLADILQSWELSIDGMVDNPRVLSFHDLLNLSRSDVLADFHCVEGWSVHDVPWVGVHLSEIVNLVQPRGGATHITYYAKEGVYLDSLPLEVALEPKTLLAYGIGCNTLSLKHGFPLRMVIPRLYAYKSTKYVERIEFTDEPVIGYWEQFPIYSYEAEVPESRLREGRY